MVAYAFPDRRPVLAIAQALYGDAGRADELRAENKVVHPLFMPAAGRALSA
jgi:prophage DNA circulation protein